MIELAIYYRYVFLKHYSCIRPCIGFLPSWINGHGDPQDHVVRSNLRLWLVLSYSENIVRLRDGRLYLFAFSQVAWVRVDTQTILSIHHNVITQNPRVTLSYNDHRSWYLHIRDVHEEDRGWYMCQVNTDPMRSRQGYLQVVGELARRDDDLFSLVHYCCSRRAFLLGRIVFVELVVGNVNGPRVYWVLLSHDNLRFYYIGRACSCSIELHHRRTKFKVGFPNSFR